MLTNQGLALPENRAGKGAATGERLVRKLDCAVINVFNDTEDRTNGCTYYQSVRGAFEEGAEAFPGACIRMKTHIQLAVRESQRYPVDLIGRFAMVDAVMTLDFAPLRPGNARRMVSPTQPGDWPGGSRRPPVASRC